MRKHHVLLHEAWSFVSSNKKEPPKVEVNVAMPCVGVQHTKNRLAVAPVRLYNRKTGAHVDTYCLIDHGATRDMCSQKLARLLDLADNPSWYNADTMLAHGEAVSMSVYDVAVNVKGINESKMHMLHSAVVLPHSKRIN